MKLHKLAALAVLGASAWWVLTGEFSTVGSAADEAAAKPAEETARALQTVGVYDVPEVMHARTIRISGRTAPDKRAEVAARAGGVVLELPFEKGQQVKEGDVILRINPEDKQAAFDAAQQLLQQREQELEAAEQLVRRGTLPKLRGDEARSARLAALNQVQAAQAELDRLEVKAPFTGVIDALNVEVGSSVQQGAPFATVIKLDPIVGVGEVNEADLGVVQVGRTAGIRLVDGRSASGTIRFISRESNPQTRTYTVEIEIPNPDNAIPAGMTAEVTLAGDQQQVTLLPRSVLALNGKGELGVRSVNADNVVVFHPIDLIDDRPEGLYLGGIPADARIIVAGQAFVADGDTVNPVVATDEEIQKLVGEVRSGLSQ